MNENIHTDEVVWTDDENTVVVPAELTPDREPKEGEEVIHISAEPGEEVQVD